MIPRTSGGPIQLRDAMEIQRAHDLLIGVLLDECPLKQPKESKKLMQVIAATLCWVLCHDHNTSVQEMLDYVEKAADAAGYSFKKKGDPDA